MASMRTMFRPGTVIRRGGLLATLAFFWGVLPWALVYFMAYFQANVLVRTVLGFWFLGSVIPVLPGTGFLAGYVGVVTRDRRVSFLLGLFPNVLTLIILMLWESDYLVNIWSPAGTAVAFLLSLNALAFGLMGFAGSLYSEWTYRRLAVPTGTLVPAVIAGVSGLFIWFVTAWIWPSWHVMIPIQRG